MAEVKVTLQPAAIVRVYPPNEAGIATVVRVISVGTQGPKGDPGEQFDIFNLPLAPN